MELTDEVAKLNSMDDPESMYIKIVELCKAAREQGKEPLYNTLQSIMKRLETDYFINDEVIVAAKYL